MQWSSTAFAAFAVLHNKFFCPFAHGEGCVTLSFHFLSQAHRIMEWNTILGPGDTEEESHTGLFCRKGKRRTSLADRRTSLASQLSTQGWVQRNVECLKTRSQIVCLKLGSHLNGLKETDGHFAAQKSFDRLFLVWGKCGGGAPAG